MKYSRKNVIYLHTIDVVMVIIDEVITQRAIS